MSEINEALPEDVVKAVDAMRTIMLIELAANRRKGDRPGWLAMDPMALVLEVFHHAAKLHHAVTQKDLGAIREYAADVGNMAMMVADRCGVLPAELPKAPCVSTLTNPAGHVWTGTALAHCRECGAKQPLMLGEQHCLDCDEVMDQLDHEEHVGLLENYEVGFHICGVAEPRVVGSPRPKGAPVDPAPASCPKCGHDPHVGWDCGVIWCACLGDGT